MRRCQHRHLASSVLLAALLLASPGASAEDLVVLRGPTTIETDSAGDILVAVESLSTTQPGLSSETRVFVLQRSQEDGERVFIPTTEAVVHSTPRALTVKIAGGSVLVLALTDHEVPSAESLAQRFSVLPTDVLVMRGVGLAQYSGGLSGPGPAVLDRFMEGGDVGVAPAPQHGEKPCPDGGNSVHCSGGGCGSSSCSVSGCFQFPTACNVSCNEGNFACCGCPSTGGATCHCYEESTYCTVPC